MAEAGLSEWFPQLVAHSIHSLTVEDIRYYFKPDVSENNGIPTGNVSVVIVYLFRILENPAVCTSLQLIFILRCLTVLTYVSVSVNIMGGDQLSDQIILPHYFFQ